MYVLHHFSDLLVGQINAKKWVNRSLYDASMKFGTMSPQVLYNSKSTLATSISKMAAIFSRWPPILERISTKVVQMMTQA